MRPDLQDQAFFPMLTRLRVNGFKNLIDVDLHFGPFTCIAGANAVGKSNLFDVMLFLNALMDAPIMDAAMAVRGEKGLVSDIRHLFTQTEAGVLLPLEIEAEMLVPPAGSDDLDQPAEARTTFLVYSLELRYRPPAGAVSRPRIELVEETLEYIKKGEAHTHLPFRHTPKWRDSVVKGRRTSPYISTEIHEGEFRVVKLHQDSSTSGGRTRLFQAEKLPRTVLSTVNAQESPTAVLARREMLNWRLLQLEPAALRAPDGFDAPSQLALSGAHLPATLFRLSQEQARDDGGHSAPEESSERGLTLKYPHKSASGFHAPAWEQIQTLQRHETLAAGAATTAFPRWSVETSHEGIVAAHSLHNSLF
ncbi:AAA family ATPase [Candidatus Thiosymbion oneisti]|uniref:AAA family ATPase n=1 Tax=Candidatus Thiosymbion oneisti TaxID=589554 RepID=UPI00105F2BD4|nr:hypothetical protein [Candidatus Thiosymbion oneisti]